MQSIKHSSKGARSPPDGLHLNTDDQALPVKIKIRKIEVIQEGYMLTGFITTSDHRRLLRWGLKNHEFKDLTCPNCENQLVFEFKVATMAKNGYKFLALLECHNKKCKWKKDLKKGMHSTKEMLARIKKLVITSKGIEIEAQSTN